MGDKSPLPDSKESSKIESDTDRPDKELFPEKNKIKSTSNNSPSIMSSDISSVETDDGGKNDDSESTAGILSAHRSSTPKIKESRSKMEEKMDKLMKDFKVIYKTLKKKKKYKEKQELHNALDKMMDIAAKMSQECEILLYKNKELQMLKKDKDLLEKTNGEQQQHIKNLEEKIKNMIKTSNESKKHAKILVKNFNASKDGSQLEEISQKDLTQSSTPKEKRLQKFNDIITRNMTNIELLRTYAALTRRRQQGDAAEALKYYNYLEGRLAELQEITKEDIQSIIQQNKELQEQMNNYNTLRQVVKDQGKTLQELHQEKETITKDYVRMMEEMSMREVTLTEELEKYKEQIREKEELIKSYIENDNEQITKTNIQVIMEKLNRIEMSIKNKEFNTILQAQQMEKETTPENIHKTDHQEIAKSYSDITQQQPTLKEKKNITQFSKSAILIRRTKNTQLSTNDIRKILTRETKENSINKQIYCGTTKDNNTLIIKTTKDEDTNKLLEIIENITSLKEAIETTYKSNNIKKIIILGIPTELTEEEIVKHIESQYKLEIPVAVNKNITKDHSRNYQLVLEVEDWAAKDLVRRKKLQLGFIQCRINLYMPVLRCNNCQAYGHSSTNCRRQEICQYCTKPHRSLFCHIRKTPNKQRCINCVGTSGDFPHAANSPDCPAFHYHLQLRNQLVNNNPINSRR